MEWGRRREELGPDSGLATVLRTDDVLRVAGPMEGVDGIETAAFVQGASATTSARGATPAEPPPAHPRAAPSASATSVTAARVVRPTPTICRKPWTWSVKRRSSTSTPASASRRA